MAERSYRLPAIEDLSKQQEDARDLPVVGQHLVVGGPGTGKTVVALLRTRRLARAALPYVFLVYNRLLLSASKQLYGDDLNCAQWQSWFIKQFKNYTGENVPHLAGHQLDFDWTRMQQLISAQPPKPEEPLHLIIDEGQDLPAEFYVALIAMGFENFYVVADQNQQIVPGRNSARRDIEKSLGIDSADTVELLENYRNSYPVAALARCFYTGDPASPAPALPAHVTPATVPILFDYTAEQFDRMIKRILIRYHNYPAELIGIVAPNNRIREKYYQRLTQLQLGEHSETAGSTVPIQTYAQVANENAVSGIRFGGGGIAVINAQSCKGLEFDFVFLADINHHRFHNADPDSSKRLFYVMVARAISRIILLREKSRHCPVAPILPTENAIMERR